MKNPFADATPPSSAFFHKLQLRLNIISMVRHRSLLLAALILSCLTVAAVGQDDEIEDIEVVEEEKAFLIVRKNIVDREKVVVGKAITVEIEIHNAGTRYCFVANRGRSSSIKTCCTVQKFAQAFY